MEENDGCCQIDHRAEIAPCQGSRAEIIGLLCLHAQAAWINSGRLCVAIEKSLEAN